MSAPTCVRCGRPTPDGCACSGCVAKARAQLAEIADLTPAARDVATRQNRRSGSGGGSGKPGSRLPLDLTATAKLDGIANALIGWVRHISETRGVRLP